MIFLIVFYSFGDFSELFQPVIEGMGKFRFFLVEISDTYRYFPELRVIGPVIMHDYLGDLFCPGRLRYPELAAVAQGAPDQAPDDIALVDIRRGDTAHGRP